MDTKCAINSCLEVCNCPSHELVQVCNCPPRDPVQVCNCPPRDLVQVCNHPPHDLVKAFDYFPVFSCVFRCFSVFVLSGELSGELSAQQKTHHVGNHLREVSFLSFPILYPPQKLNSYRRPFLIITCFRYCVQRARMMWRMLKEKKTKTSTTHKISNKRPKSFRHLYFGHSGFGQN